MYLVDFVFDGLKLSDFGCMVGSAVTDNGDTADMGSVINLETVVNHGTYRSEIVNADYSNPFTITFDIFKYPCKGTQNDYFEDKEITWFMRWLNRKEYKKFQPIYDNPKDFYRIFYMGTFTECKAINIQGQVYGFALTFTSNSPFGYLDYKPNTFNVINQGGTFDIINPYTKESETLFGGILTIYDESEELGCIYPESFKIKTNQSGRLVIWNNFDKKERYTEILNCEDGEIITFDCVHKTITSDKAHVKLYNDFNYVFPRLNNEFDDRMNKFYISLNSEVTISYNPIRKVGVIA